MAQIVHRRTILATLLLVVWCMSLSPTATNGKSCPRSCDCHMTMNGISEIACFTGDIKGVDFQALSAVDDEVSLNVICASDVPVDLTSVMLDNIKNLRSISFSNCKISHFHRKAFAGSNNLQSIKIISASNLHLQLHPSVFDSVSSLQYLTLTGSGIIKIPDICILSNMTYLNISANSLESFNESGLVCENSVFLKHLITIDISNNHFKTITELQIAGQSFPNLEVLMVAQNNINILPTENPLRQFTRLKYLDLSDNNIDSLPAELLLASNDIEVLRLANNKLNDLPESIFKHAKKLRRIELQKNYLHDTVWSTFVNSQTVQYLDLSFNRLTFLNQSTINQLTQLEFLNLASNFIASITARTFQNQQRLHAVNLANNQIARIDNEFLYGLLSLTRLELQNNVIHSILDDVFNDVTGLTHLNISTNYIYNLPSIKKLLKLFVFDASHNVITNISEDYFRGQSLIGNIDLSNNRLSWLPDSLFSPCRSLENLDLSNNLLNYLHPSLFLGLNIKSLRLQGNKISSIGIQFSSLKNLKDLNLSNNAIRDIIQSFTFHKSLVLLDLENNEIEHIRPNAFVKFSDIKVINLRFNNISTLSKDSLATSTDRFTQTRFLIDENPLKCDCNLLWLKYWHQHTDGPIITNFNTTRCTGAYEYPEFIVAYVPEERFLCQYQQSCAGSCKCCDFTACDCKYKCPEKCECLHSADLVHVHIVKCSNKNKTRIDEFIPKIATFLDISGNSFSSVPSHIFLGMSQLEVLLINNSEVQHLSNGSFVGLSNLRSLDLHQNFINGIIRGIFIGVPRLQRLDLDNNPITYIQDGAFSNMIHLETIRLSNHNLLRMSDYISALPFNVKDLTLFSKSWECDCILYFSAKHHTKAFTSFTDSRTQSQFIDITCIHGNNQRKALVTFSKSCEANNSNYFKPSGSAFEELHENDEDVTYEPNPPESKSTNVVKKDMHENIMNYIGIIYVPILIASIIVFVIIMCFVCRREFVKCWLLTKYSKYHEAELLYDKERYYDGFVAYHPLDDTYVVKELAFRLERGKTKYRLLLLHRDFPAGSSLNNFIDRSVKSSHRTIIVLSSDFITNTELLKCVTNSVKNDSVKRLIFVIVGKIDKSKMDPVLMYLLKRGKCVHFQDNYFWDKICFYLPDPGKTTRNICHVDAQPYASTDISNLSSSMMDNQAYEEPFPVKSRPLPEITEYAHASQTYTYNSGSQHSSNIYEEIKENQECISMKYAKPWTLYDMEFNLQTMTSSSKQV